ncbi:glycosyltransferase family 1 protein [Algoriphagus lacus]|uniref:Glycosyltransferase family 1 protein n=1 Tax=Algoriphagus lacus TaxID=2056311 RepID=A0A418PLQ2_9BACT|nr:glycosyltransferase [Algoriphagus lacus]RIW12249.1 glycosyltransferase family 1 protein [Algoriphagus lacus]
MHLLVIGHVVHKLKDGKFFAYGPYVREMNLWFSHVDCVTILSPLDLSQKPDPIDLPYNHSALSLEEVPEFSVLSIKEILGTFLKFPVLWTRTWKAMKNADHIHLRCPGNMGLLGAMVQIFFPNKIKSAKYAGNWDRSSVQPFTYRLQQKILSNPFLTKKMQVLVYGEWPNESLNIRPFFTASYSENEKEDIVLKKLNPEEDINLIFVGGLNSGKQPMISAEVAKELKNSGKKVRLDFYGEGPERNKLESFAKENDLQDSVFIHGNVSAEVVKKAFQQAHFLIFISQSEGWPKVVAEAMFWGCLPITTAVSCVPQMLGFGERGDLVTGKVDEVINSINKYWDQPDLYSQKVLAAANWSRQYTLEKFEQEIQSVLLNR